MSNNLKNKEVLLIGAGSMAVSYSKVLSAMGIDYLVIGRGEDSAKSFESLTGKAVITGGLNSFLQHNSINRLSYAIVTVNVESLLPTLLELVKAGVENILIEKPAALSIDQLIETKKDLESTGGRIFVAYNRRFYASVFEVERLIAEDGGLRSMQFEFTEWTHKIDPAKKNKEVLANWFFANSTHVVNLAFFLGGKPVSMSSFSLPGILEWHGKTNFAGSGITEKNVLFSYLSNWESAGRWAIELLTEKRRIYLKPLEGVGIQLRGTIPVIDHSFDDTLDKDFKPGLYKQVLAFLENDHTRMVDIQEHIADAGSIYKNMLS